MQCLNSKRCSLLSSYSRPSYIADYSQGGTLPDGTPCWKDFSQSRNNRFLTAEGTSKNRIVAPAKILLVEQGSPENVTSSQSSLSSSRGSSPEEVPDSFTSNGSVPTSHILPTSVSVTLPTVESERHYAGHCHTSSPGTSHSKQHSPDESTAPLSVVQLVHQVMQQNKELQERQGMLHTIFSDLW